MHGSELILSKSFFFQTEQSDVVFIKLQTFPCSHYVKRVFYRAYVWKYTEMCKNRFEVQLLQNPPLPTVPVRHICIVKCTDSQPRQAGSHMHRLAD